MTTTHESRITSETPLSDPGVREWLPRQDGWIAAVWSMRLPVGDPYDGWELAVCYQGGVAIVAVPGVDAPDIRLDHITTVGQLCKLVEALTGNEMEVKDDEQ